LLPDPLNSTTAGAGPWRRPAPCRRNVRVAAPNAIDSMTSVRRDQTIEASRQSRRDKPLWSLPYYNPAL
jgi:hypothetical protein